MTELLTAAQTRVIEAAAIASGEVTGLELMERAGAGVVAAVMEEWPALAEGPHRAVVLCGPGGNGGDGFVVARLLKARGWEVEVFLYGDPARMPPDARVNFERWGEPVGSFGEYNKRRTWGCDLLVDALFGTGLTRTLRDLGELFWNMEDMVDCCVIEFGNRRGFPAIVAVDLPSGLCSDSGRQLTHEDVHNRFSAAAHLTVTFHAMKPGHVLDVGPQQCGKVVVKDIGIPHRGSPAGKYGARHATLAGPGHLSFLRKETWDHKYAHGHALILSGPATRTGAARLAARGALRVGAGVVTVGAPAGALAEHAARLDAVMLREVADGAALAGVLEDRRINAVCVGPGLGFDARAAGVVAAVLPGRGEPRPTGDVGRGSPRLGLVLDADALTLLSRDPALFAQLHDRCVLTPHAGEFARLFPDIAAELEAPATKGPAYSKVDATRAAAARAGCVVLFKGPDTVIADPEGRCSINSAHYDRAAPWLATAGSGDVLAGFITGLLARGFTPMQAAETGAWLHVECARTFGPGLIAEDLPEMLPQVLRSLGVT